MLYHRLVACCSEMTVSVCLLSCRTWPFKASMSDSDLLRRRLLLVALPLQPTAAGPASHWCCSFILSITASSHRFLSFTSAAATDLFSDVLKRSDAINDWENIFYWHIKKALNETKLARIVTSTRKHDHIRPVLKRLHWLPVRQRVMWAYKTAMLTYKSLNIGQPEHLSVLLNHYTPLR